MQFNNEIKETNDIPPKAEVKSSVENKTRISTAWLLMVSFIIGLTLLLIFILQNLQDIYLHIFNFHWKIPLGIAMLISLVAGGLLVALFGTARVVQLGRKIHHDKT